MTPQNKCVSLETAEKLKEAGFPQDTERRWIRTEDAWFIDPMMATPDVLINHGVWYSAPDAQEIMEELPCFVGRFRMKVMRVIFQGNYAYYVAYQSKLWVSKGVKKRTHYKPKRNLFFIRNESLAECLAQAFSFLKEKDLLKQYGLQGQSGEIESG